VAIVQEEGTTGTALCSAAVALLALPSLAMADEVGSVTIGAVQALENHEATRSRWGHSASETLMENSTSTPVRHLLMRNGLACTPFRGHPSSVPSLRGYPQTTRSAGGSWLFDSAPPGGQAPARALHVAAHAPVSFTRCRFHGCSPSRAGSGVPRPQDGLG